MKQYQFKVYLLRNKEIIKEATVWEFDNDCLHYNLFVQALHEFEDIMQDKDVIKIHGYRTECIKYNAIDETYTVIPLAYI